MTVGGEERSASSDNELGERRRYYVSSSGLRPLSQEQGNNGAYVRILLCSTKPRQLRMTRTTRALPPAPRDLDANGAVCTQPAISPTYAPQGLLGAGDETTALGWKLISMLFTTQC